MNIYGKTITELEEFVVQNKYPKYVAQQIANWMYQKKVLDFFKMNNISNKIRKELSQIASIDVHQPVKQKKSKDGTIKFLFQYPDKALIETVYIPDNDRHTLCISTQVGCKYNCEFCMTGKAGFTRNLSVGEIINQYHNIPQQEKITNIVYMGMGEPLDNYENLIKSLEIFNSKYGFNIGNKRITISTIGILPQLENLIKIGKFRLALSLHFAISDVRKQFMPVQKVHNIKKVLDTIKKYKFSADKRFSIEYIVFKGINDRDEDIAQIVKLLHGVKCRVNLLHFHDIPNTKLQSVSHQQMELFKNKLIKKGIQATIRKSRGQDIEAACGLLSGKSK